MDLPPIPRYPVMPFLLKMSCSFQEIPLLLTAFQVLCAVAAISFPGHRFMDWLSLLLVGTGLSMDAFAVSVSCGIASS